MTKYTGDYYSLHPRKKEEKNFPPGLLVPLEKRLEQVLRLNEQISQKRDEEKPPTRLIRKYTVATQRLNEYISGLFDGLLNNPVDINEKGQQTFEKFLNLLAAASPHMDWNYKRSDHSFSNDWRTVIDVPIAITYGVLYQVAKTLNMTPLEMQIYSRGLYNTEGKNLLKDPLPGEKYKHSLKKLSSDQEQHGVKVDSYDTILLKNAGLLPNWH